jgi:hypothetical protein
MHFGEMAIRWIILGRYCEYREVQSANRFAINAKHD